MDDIFSGIRGIDNDSTTEVPAEDKTDLLMVATNWAIIIVLGFMLLWGKS